MKFKRIAITSPEIFVGEGEEIARLLEGGFDRVHVRKPKATISETAALILSIPPRLRHRISLHDHFELADAFGVGGVHLNKRNPKPPKGWSGIISRSLHSIEEIGQADDYDYAFLSPIFPSISKPGYHAEWDEEALRKAASDKIIALGGATPDKFGYLASLGFGGAAMLGSIWGKPKFRGNFALQLITHPSQSYTYGQEAEMALKGGCRWVQIRHKDASFQEIKSDILAVWPLCREYGATLIVDDHAELVNSFGLDGVHLGKNDMPIAEARKLVGPRKIIGATANSYSDIERAYCQGADYVGLGPFRFTNTKSNLSPVLGLDGYREIKEQCRAAGIDIPIVAIGGIAEEDIAEIMRTGVNGIAISSTILNAENPEEKTRKIINTIKKCQN
ncbi:MAG: thiamine phosphate synthase [Clostridium sp.]|nr:thiamine phosphate synthase [Clostridium sp.]